MFVSSMHISVILICTDLASLQSSRQTCVEKGFFYHLLQQRFQGENWDCISLYYCFAHQMLMSFKNSDASFLLGKYSVMATAVVLSKIFKASVTFCLLLPGCNVSFDSFGALTVQEESCQPQTRHGIVSKRFPLLEHIL